MGFLKALFGGGEQSRFAEIGNLDAVCPYCGKSLEKKPGRKKKCPHCGKYIYVRTRPSDGKRVLVTVGQMKVIEDLRPKTEEQRREYEREYAESEAALRKRHGHIPAVSDVLWRMLNKRLISYAQRGDWGFYTNTRFEMAELLEREQKLDHALGTYLEVGYLDLNGPMNMGGTSPRLRDQFPPFEAERAYLAPAIAQRVQSISEELGLELAEVESRFIEAADRTHESLRVPVSPTEAWKALASGLQRG
jgi:DNA-directed RNA polymerase subunit RPC12/RpoP